MSENNLLAIPLKATDSVRLLAPSPRLASFAHVCPTQLPSLADDILAFIASASETTHPAAVEEDARALQALREKALGTGEATVPLVNLGTLTDLTRCVAIYALRCPLS